MELDSNMRTSFLEKYAVVEDLMVNQSDSEHKTHDRLPSMIEDTEEHNLDLIFIEVYAFVLQKLRGYFDLFKRSNAFIELENEIRKKERLYEILIDSNLISN